MSDEKVILSKENYDKLKTIEKQYEKYKQDNTSLVDIVVRQGEIGSTDYHPIISYVGCAAEKIEKKVKDCVLGYNGLLLKYKQLEQKNNELKEEINNFENVKKFIKTIRWDVNEFKENDDE